MQWLYLDANQQQVSAEEEQLGDLVQNGSIQAETMLWNETMTDWQSAQAIWPETFPAASAAPAVQRPQGLSAPPKIKPRGKRAAKPAGRPVAGATTARLAKGSTTSRLKPPKKAPSKKAATQAADSPDTEVEEGAADLVRRSANLLHGYHGWLMAVAILSMIFGAFMMFLGIAAMVGKPGLVPVIPILIGVIPIAVSAFLIKAAGNAKLAVESGTSQPLSDCLEQLGKYFLGIGIFLLILLLLMVTGIVLAILSPGMFVGGS